MKQRLSWAASFASALLLALLIDMNNAPPASARALVDGGIPVNAGGSDGSTGGSAGPPPGSFAGAASMGGFQQPLQPMDVSLFTIENAVPEGCRLLNMRELCRFTYDGDYMPMSSPFDNPVKIRHPKRTIPDDIKALDGKQIAVAGFMLPFDFTPGGTAVFALLKSQAGCCFGRAPRLNEWIQVKMPKPTQVIMDTPVLVRGILKVKEIREAGNLMGIYGMAGEAVEIAKIEELKD